MKRTIFIVVACLAATFAEAQQAVVVYTRQGTKASYPTVAVRNLQFKNGDLQINLFDGTLAEYGITEIRKITFSDTELSTPQNLAISTVTFYPNPAHDAIVLSGLSNKNGLIRIYGIDGRLVLQETITSDQTLVDISRLEKGIYIIKVENTSLKLQKI